MYFTWNILKLYSKSKAEVEALVDVGRMYSRDICIWFGLQKCASMRIERGKMIADEGTVLSNGELITNLKGDYKYLGILEVSKQNP